MVNDRGDKMEGLRKVIEALTEEICDAVREDRVNDARSLVAARDMLVKTLLEVEGKGAVVPFKDPGR